MSMDILRKHLLGYFLLILAGGVLYVAFEMDVRKGLGLFFASVLIDIGIENITLSWKKAKGEID